MKYVITGAPSSGKTTLVDGLSGVGYSVFHESARIYIENCIGLGRDIDESSIQFQLDIMNLQLSREMQIPKSRVTFLDRGIPDSFAYLRLLGVDLDDVLAKTGLPDYTKVFFLEQLPIVSDGIRVTDKVVVESIGRNIFDIYAGLGYDVVTVPMFAGDDIESSVSERIQFILGNM